MRVFINVDAHDMACMKNGDILMYDANKQKFYRTTAQDFFAKYEKKLDDLLAKYDAQIKELTEANQNLMDENKKFKETLENNFNTLASRNREINKKLIEMVENVMEVVNK